MDICADIILSGSVVPRLGQVEQMIDDYAVMMGGSAAIFACQCARMGLKTAGVGVVGDDAFGGTIMDTMRACGVETRHIITEPETKTGATFIICKDDDRGMLTYAGTIDAAKPEHFTDILMGQARHLHIASYYLMPQLRPAYPDIVRRARARDMTVSIDTNWDPDETWAGIRELLPLCDLFMPNENELRAITGEDNLDKALTLARQWVPHVALKLGEDGARYAGVLGDVTVPSFPAPRVVDAVGAGDSFDGAYLWGFLQGKSPRECLLLGCAAGSMNVRGAGGTSSQGNLQELLALSGVGAA